MYNVYCWFSLQLTQPQNKMIKKGSVTQWYSKLKIDNQSFEDIKAAMYEQL